MVEFFVVYDPVYEEHRPPPHEPHPENPKRLRIALEALREENLWSRATLVKPIEIDIDVLLKVHDASYVKLVEKLCQRTYARIDPDTYVSRSTWRAALMAFGGAIAGADLVLKHSEALALALVRPPGHHAGRYGRALGAPTQGFCIFNNIAGAAIHILDKGFKPILILDIDVHHGNGTQEIFWEDPRVIHFDIHEEDIYPGTGSIEDIGSGEGEGTKINVPLPPFSGDDDYIYVIEELFVPIVEQIKPMFIAVSAGFDAYQHDGLASMMLTQTFYLYIGALLRRLSKKFRGLLIVLEGGYTTGLRYGLPALVRGYLEIDLEDTRKNIRIEPNSNVREVVNYAKNVLKRYYEL